MGETTYQGSVEHDHLYLNDQGHLGANYVNPQQKKEEKVKTPGDDDCPYPVEGIPVGPHIESKNDEKHKIPFAPDMPVRREISELADPQNPYHEQWTLFVLALEKFKATPVEKKLSYFRVAGIHSAPYITWDEGKPRPLGSEDDGYCRHNSLLFPTWHRAYMLLYEKVLYENMLEVIKDFNLEEKDKAVWEKAASEWRLPYWDWAREQKIVDNFSVPQVLTVTGVYIFPPTSVGDKYGPVKSVADVGQCAIYPNPLYGFDNPEVDRQGNPRQFGYMPPGKKVFSLDNSYNGDDDIPREDTPANIYCNPWSMTSSTGRWGIQITPSRRYTGLDGVNNFGMINTSLSRVNDNPDKTLQWYQYNPGNFSEAVNRLLSLQYNSTWGAFATTKWFDEETDPRAFMSLEYLHNNVHKIAGGSDFKYGVGHMSDVPVAAFDPLFWLHHCQIDRLFAMFQALHWDTWWDKKQPNTEGKVDGEGYKVDATPTDPLKPFRKRASDGSLEGFWNSNDTRNWTKLNYQYDTLVASSTAVGEDGYLNEAVYQEELRANINKLYPGSSQAIGTIRHDANIQAPKGLKTEAGQPFNDYVINVKYDRFALEGGRSYTIQFFLGGAKDEEQTNFTDANLIGEVYTFTGPTPTNEDEAGCKHCLEQKKRQYLSCAQVPITIPVINHIFCQDKDYPIEKADDIVEYLRLHLNWRFLEFGGIERPAQHFPNTVITVFEGKGVPQHTGAVDLGDTGNLTEEERKEKQHKEEVKVAAVAEAAAAAQLSAGVIDLNHITVNENEEPVKNINVNGEKVEVTVGEDLKTQPPVQALPPKYISFKPVYKITDGKVGGAKDPHPK